jgi:hypothetical protein
MNPYLQPFNQSTNQPIRAVAWLSGVTGSVLGIFGPLVNILLFALILHIDRLMLGNKGCRIIPCFSMSIREFPVYPAAGRGRCRFLI